MFRKSGLALSLVGSLALAVAACQASFQAGSGANEPAPPPPPPPPTTTAAPAATTPAEPAAATSATPASTETAATPTTDQSDLKVKRGRLEVPGNIVFETGKATLDPGGGSEAVLAQVKAFLDKNPSVTKLRIEGHTDHQGDADANVELSGQRSKTVKQWLVDHGIDAGRLLATGFGSQRPIADNSTEEGRAQNRRTEFHVAEKYNKKFLGKNPTGGGKVFE